MKKIASFTVNHLTLVPGLYVSRTDTVNSNIITTFDIRITRPNYEPVMDNPAIHAIEHLGGILSCIGLDDLPEVEGYYLGCLFG